MQRRTMPLKINRETNYSKDKTCGASSHEGLDLEDPAKRAGLRKTGLFELWRRLEQAPDTPAYITIIHFEKGKPTALDGKATKASTPRKAERCGRRERHRHHRHCGKPSCGHEKPRV